MTDDQDRLQQEGLNSNTSIDDLSQSAAKGYSEFAEAVSKDADLAAVGRSARPAERKYVAYTVKLPSDQLAALQSIWLELKRLYGTHSPDKSGMIQQAVEGWLKRWDGPDHRVLLDDLLEIRQDTRRRQYRKSP